MSPARPPAVPPPSHLDAVLDQQLRAAREASLLAREAARDRAMGRPVAQPAQPPASRRPRVTVRFEGSKPKPAPNGGIPLHEGLLLGPEEVHALDALLATHPALTRGRGR